MVPTKIFGSKMKEVTGDWRGFFCEQLHESRCSSNIISVMKNGDKYRAFVAWKGQRK
jgi:hypothetical protein